MADHRFTYWLNAFFKRVYDQGPEVRILLVTLSDPDTLKRSPFEGPNKLLMGQFQDGEVYATWEGNPEYTTPRLRDARYRPGHLALEDPMSWGCSAPESVATVRESWKSKLSREATVLVRTYLALMPMEVQRPVFGQKEKRSLISSISNRFGDYRFQIDLLIALIHFAETCEIESTGPANNDGRRFNFLGAIIDLEDSRPSVLQKALSKLRAEIDPDVLAVLPSHYQVLPYIRDDYERGDEPEIKFLVGRFSSLHLVKPNAEVYAIPAEGDTFCLNLLHTTQRGYDWKRGNQTTVSEIINERNKVIEGAEVTQFTFNHLFKGCLDEEDFTTLVEYYFLLTIEAGRPGTAGVYLRIMYSDDLARRLNKVCQRWGEEHGNSSP